MVKLRSLERRRGKEESLLECGECSMFVLEDAIDIGERRDFICGKCVEVKGLLARVKELEDRIRGNEILSADGNSGVDFLEVSSEIVSQEGDDVLVQEIDEMISEVTEGAGTDELVLPEGPCSILKDKMDSAKGIVIGDSIVDSMEY